jgi:hypothetical protein
MSEQEEAKLEAVLMAAKSYAEAFQKDVSEINLSASFHGRLGSGSVEHQSLDAAENRYRDACIFMLGQFSDPKAPGSDLRKALERLEPQFHPEPIGMGRYKHEFSVDFGEALSRVREKICHQVEHGILKMGNEPRNTTIIQHGPNSVAVATGDHSQVSVTVGYSNIAHLAAEAAKELQAWSIPAEKTDALKDRYMSIEDEAKKPDPDKSRMKRIAQGIENDMMAIKDAAISAGGSAFGAAAALALVSAIQNL